MRKNFLGIIFLISCFSVRTNAQTVINYQTWASASGCNIFASSTTVSSVAHLTAIGQPQYDGTNNSVNLDAEISSNLGTEYRITYNFLKGYSYRITINAKRSSITSGGDDNLRLDLNSGGSGNNTTCNGPGTIDISASGNFKNSKPIVSTSFADYTYNYNSLSSSEAYLMVAAIPVSGSQAQTIYVRKITIEITGTAELTLSPTSLPLTCGTVAS